MSASHDSIPEIGIGRIALDRVDPALFQRRNSRRVVFDPKDVQPVFELKLLVGSTADPPHPEHERRGVAKWNRPVVDVELFGRRYCAG